MSKRKRNDNLQVQVESNGPQGAVVQTIDTGTAHEQLPSGVSVGQPQGGNQPERDPEDAHRWEESLVPRAIIAPPEVIEEQIVRNGIINARVDLLTMPRMKDEINIINEVRDLLFSIRDNSIYCPICRYPEFAPNETRSSHFEGCSVGLMCEKLLALYPKDGCTVKWRK